MEIVIYRRLKQHLGMCSILTSEQYGFWDGVMPFMNLLILFMKHGITNNTWLTLSVTWLIGTLEDSVSLAYRATHCFKSECELMKCGALQGSVLGPLLFKMYIIEVQEIMDKLSHIILSADYTSIRVTSTNYNDLQKKWT